MASFKSFISVLVTLLVMGVSSAVSASPIDWFSQLAVGTKVRIMGVTSRLHNANSTIMSDYEAWLDGWFGDVGWVQDLHTSGDVFASTKTEAARDHTGTRPPSAGGPDLGPIIMDWYGNVIASNYERLCNNLGQIARPIRFDEDGTDVGLFTAVWTGAQNQCGSGNNPLGSSRPTAGITDSLNWLTDHVGDGKATEKRFYWITGMLERVLDPVSPPPLPDPIPDPSPAPVPEPATWVRDSLPCGEVSSQGGNTSRRAIARLSHAARFTTSVGRAVLVCIIYKMI